MKILIKSILIVLIVNDIIVCQTVLNSFTEQVVGYDPLPCNVSVNRDLDFYNRSEYLNVVRSTIKIVRRRDGIVSSCSATLVNRNVNQNELGIYFVTAWHCFKDGQDC
jgi:hypothetical protein